MTVEIIALVEKNYGQKILEEMETIRHSKRS